MRQDICNENINIVQRTKRAADHVPTKLVQDMEGMVSWRGMKGQRWAIKNSTYYINITLK